MISGGPDRFGMQTNGSRSKWLVRMFLSSTKRAHLRANGDRAEVCHLIARLKRDENRTSGCRGRAHFTLIQATRAGTKGGNENTMKRGTGETISGERRKKEIARCSARGGVTRLSKIKMRETRPPPILIKMMAILVGP